MLPLPLQMSEPAVQIVLGDAVHMQTTMMFKDNAYDLAVYFSAPRFHYYKGEDWR